MKAKVKLTKAQYSLLKDLQTKAAGHYEDVRLLLSQYEVHVPNEQKISLWHIYIAHKTSETFLRKLYNLLYANAANGTGDESGVLYWLGKAGSGLQAIFGDFAGGSPTDQTFSHMQQLQAMQLQEAQLKAKSQSQTITMVVVILAILAVIGFCIMAMKRR